MGDAIVVITLEAEGVRKPIEWHALEGVMATNSMKRDEHRHEHQGKITVLMIIITDGYRGDY